jgi:hypothetical protein
MAVFVNNTFRRATINKDADALSPTLNTKPGTIRKEAGMGRTKVLIKDPT